MECARAAVVAFEVSAAPFDDEGPDVPEEICVRLRPAARVERRLLTCPDDDAEPEAWNWQCHVAMPLFGAGKVELGEERISIPADAALWRTWRRAREWMKGTAEKWTAAVRSMPARVPRDAMQQILIGHLSKGERDARRFGRQVEALLALPEDSQGLQRCQKALHSLIRWMNTAEMSDAAEEYFRTVTKVREDTAVLLDGLREAHSEAVRESSEQVASRAEEGICFPADQIAILSDTLFVFDGQHSEDDMRSLMAAHLHTLEEHSARGAAARDRYRDSEAAERPSDIPDSVRARVWRRDMGRCSICGATEELEFGHVIPRALGGASTVRNVHVICTTCSEKKGSHVAPERASRRRPGRNTTLDLFNDQPSG